MVAHLTDETPAARLSRRACLRIMGHGAAAAALGPVGCSAHEAGAAVLEVEERRALVSLWSRVHTIGEVVLETAGGSGRGRAVFSHDESGAGLVRLSGLEPATAYRAIVLAGGNELLERRFSTPPDVFDVRDVRIAVMADVDTRRDLSLFDALADAAPDVTVSLGDWPYADDSGQLIPVDEVVARHVDARSAARLQPWLARTSVRAIYDDHEVRNNWAGEETLGIPGDPYETALGIWDGFFPRYDPLTPRYRNWRWGAHVECFLLDTRRYRSPAGATDGEAKTMLGLGQRRWLLGALERSSAPFKIVLTSVPLDFGHGGDHWSGYRYERDLILDAIAGAEIPGVLFVSGDQHWFGAHVHRHGVREFQIGPAASELFDPPDPAPGVLTRASEPNFGLLDIGASGLRFRSIGMGGKTIYDETFTPESLRFGVA